MGEEYEEMVSPGASLSAAERTATKSSAATKGFTLDTSGAIGVPGQTLYFWPDLDAFTQGFLAAFLESTGSAFSDLAPETLAAILGDCRLWLVGYPGRNPHSDLPASGRLFWEIRQAGRRDSFPPLVPTLGDDGKVYLRKATGEQP